MITKLPVTAQLAALSPVLGVEGEQIDRVDQWRHNIVFLIDRVKTWVRDPSDYNTSRLHLMYLSVTATAYGGPAYVTSLSIMDMVIAICDDFYDNSADGFNHAVLSTWPGYSGNPKAPIAFEDGDIWKGENAAQQISFGEFIAERLSDLVDVYHWSRIIPAKPLKVV